MAQDSKFTAGSARFRPGTLVLIGVLHVLAIYGLMRAFAPDMTIDVERSVMAAFDVNSPPPPEPPEPVEAEPEPDEGAAGDPGKEAVPRPVTAPTPQIVLKRDEPAPRASSTGAAVISGAREQGDGTGAAGSGLGTGSGRGGGGQGSGQGGVIATRPVHISGGIDNARDYPVPEGGRSARRGNEVIVQVTVDTNGRARDCRIYRPSADATADQITCQLVVERLRFKPALNSDGEPVAAPFYWKQRWF